MVPVLGLKCRGSVCFYHVSCVEEFDQRKAPVFTRDVLEILLIFKIKAERMSVYLKRNKNNKERLLLISVLNPGYNIHVLQPSFTFLKQEKLCNNN